MEKNNKKAPLSQEEVKEFLKQPGQIKGMALKTYADFVLKEKGERAKKKLEWAFEAVGCSPRISEMKSFDYYPAGFEIVIFVLMQRLFHFQDEDFFRLGKTEAKMPLAVRLYLRYIASPEVAARDVSKLWSFYYTAGNLKTIVFDQERKEVIVRITGFKGHPLVCKVWCGYFATVIQGLLGFSPEIKETKCVFKGDDFHEFLITWE